MCDENGQAIIFDEVDEEIQRLNDGLDEELKAALKDIENCRSSQGSSKAGISQPETSRSKYFVQLEKGKKENESYTIVAETRVEHRMFNMQDTYTHRAEPGSSHPETSGKHMHRFSNSATQPVDHSIPPVRRK